MTKRDTLGLPCPYFRPCVPLTGKSQFVVDHVESVLTRILWDASSHAAFLLIMAKSGLGRPVVTWPAHPASRHHCDSAAHRAQLGGCVEVISGANQIECDPRCLNASLQETGSWSCSLSGANCARGSAIMLNSRGESYQPVRTTKPVIGQIWARSRPERLDQAPNQRKDAVQAMHLGKVG